jgi:GR25 family glycosyltransferase involved in LPS biosynthesis
VSFVLQPAIIKIIFHFPDIDGITDTVNWNFFDRIYCISLKERPDRQAEALRQFESVGLARHVEIVTVSKHPDDPEQGIYNSHMLCMQKAIHSGAKRVLIFEDDIVFDRFSPEVFRNCIHFLSTDTHWNMVFFGCMVSRSKPTPYPSIRQVAYRSLAHAYVVNRKFAEKLVRNPWRHVPYDDMLRDLQEEHTYAIYPAFAFQSNSRSDNLRYLPLDRFRRGIGGLRRLQKMNEWYHRHRTLFIAAHIAAISGILLWFF